jgi:hypothetical protein
VVKVILLLQRKVEKAAVTIERISESSPEAATLNAVVEPNA